jgi:hypothetical protein
MSTAPVIPLSDYVSVSIMLGPQYPATPTFNSGLFVGVEAIIGAVERCRKYTSTAAMLQDGFQLSDPSYIAAQIYFSQTANGPAPQAIYIGVQVGSAIATSQLTAADTTDAGWVVGDTFTVTQAGASGALYKVTTVANGQPTAYVQISGGSGYSVAGALPAPAVSGVGTGLELDIVTIGETPVQAVAACRQAQSGWYQFAFGPQATDTDVPNLAAWAQAQTAQVMYMFTTGAAAVGNSQAGNLFATLKAASYSRTMGFYATTQQGLYPNNIYMAVGAMGVAMGLNTGLANSYFFMMYKKIVGMYAEPVTDSQKQAIEAQFGNVYVNVGNSYTWTEQGTVFSGQYMDEVLNFDMLASDYQFSTLDLFISQSTQQTEAGVTSIVQAIDSANGRAATRGFIAGAGGTWQGVNILNLQTGKALPAGYLTQAAALSTLSPTQISQRQSPPMYVALIESNGIQSVMIGVYPQR